MGGVSFVIGLLFLFVCAEAVQVLRDWWLTLWIDEAFGTAASFYITIYAALTGLFAMVVLLRGIVFAILTLRAASSIHNGVFRQV